MFEAKARAGFRVSLAGKHLILKNYKGEIIIPLDEVSYVQIQRSAYDLPFLEKTIKIYTASKNWTIRRLPSKKASELINLLQA